MSEANVDELIERGIEQQQSGDHEASVITFTEVVEIDPKHAQAWYCLAIGHSNMDQNKAAISAYRQSIEFAGEQAALPLFNLGNLYQDLEEFAEAAQCFQQATEVDPTMVDAWINLGRILDDCQNHDAAVECYDVALRIDGDESMAWSNRGNSLRSLEQYDQAIESYRKAISLDKEDFAAQVGLAGCLAEQGEFEDALKWVDDAIDATGHPLALFERATVLGKASRFQEAVEAYDQVIAVGFRSPEIWNNRGECLAKVDRIEDAVASFDEAISGDSEFAPAYFGKARVLVNADRIAEAKPIVDQLLATGNEELIASPAVQALKNIVDDVQ